MAKRQERKQRKGHLLQWHPAFYAGIQIELEEEADKLTFQREYPLATKPILIDVLIIKKKTGEALKKNIGRIFRRHNIVEYKSPKDYLGINDFYKVYAYACHYLAMSKQVKDISADELTITFVSFRYPYKMIKHLEKLRGLEISKFDEGIYYILGDSFPMQLIVTKMLSKDNNLWLSCLTNDLKDRSIIDKISREYRKHKKNEMYKSVMNIIIRANNEQFKEARNMCEAILELFQDEVEMQTTKAMNEGRIAGRNEGIITGRIENLRITIRACRDFGGTKEKVYELLVNEYKLTEEQAKDYIEQYW